MFNFCLHNKSYEKASTASIEVNLRDLNDLVVFERNKADSFLKNESIWYVQTHDGLFSDVVFSQLEDKQLSNVVLPKMFHAIDSTDSEITNFEEFDKSFKLYNAFIGIHFTDIDTSRCITDKLSYESYRKKNLWEVTPISFWERKETLFSNIILCPTVENVINTIGGTYLEQIMIQLKELDRYVSQYWKTGNFNYVDSNAKTPLNITPESKKTMGQKKYVALRTFSMPDGRRECFELHIKTGNLRFHFFPENNKIYIGYIGKHLPTDQYN
jgi:hypothetical protein